MLGKNSQMVKFCGRQKKNHFFGKIIVQSAKLILYSSPMLRISILLLALSMLQMTVSVSLLAQYSHFPVTSLEIDGIESEKFPNFTSELEIFSDIIDSSIFDTETEIDFHSDLIESSPILKISNTHSDEPTTVDFGISHNASPKQCSNFAYIQNLPDAQSVISPDSPDLISDIIYFLKDLFDDDGNYSEENWLNPIYTLNGSKVPDIYNDRIAREISIAYTTISSFQGTLTVSEFSKNVDNHNYQNYPNQGPNSPSHKQFLDNSKGDTNPSSLITLTTPSNANENSEFASFEVFELKTFREPPSLHRFSKRQRRSAWNSTTVYNWQITDFDENATAANDTPLSFTTGRLDANSSTPFKLNVVANNGIASLEVLAHGHIGGNALKDMNNPGFKFLTHGKNNTSLNDGDVTSSFDLRLTDATTGQTGIEHWLNDPVWHSWSVYASTSGADREFFLRYDYNPLNLTPVPEPSTYVMTATLLCFIGFNQKSRKSLKKIFNNFSVKPKLPSYLEKLTRSQSRP
jgi:hypothetical protein